MSLIPVDEAFIRLTHAIGPIAETECLPLRLCAGRVAAVDIVALRTQPSFDASAMDGYALRATDCIGGETQLRVTGESAAGRAFEGQVGRGETVRIFTGAPVPEGADSILIQENAERLDGDRISLLEPVVRGRHIRKAGADFAEGAILVGRGRRLTPGRIALAASGGHPALVVIRRPRVAVLATGDELVSPGSPLGPSQIVASNTYGIIAMAEAAGAEVTDLGIARDDEAEISARLDQAVAAGADVFVTIGGASVGDHDLVGAAFAAKGVELAFWKVAMRPGKPLMAGRLGAMQVIGLPGNPASSLVAATLFLRPLVHILAGHPEPTVYRRGILGADMPANDHRADFIRSTIDHSAAVMPIVSPFGRQDSSLLSVYADADVLLVRPAGAAPSKAGEPCLYVTLD